MKVNPVFELKDRGLFCPGGNFYIDPSRGVEHAVITHAHSDHARRGSQTYICTTSGAGLLRVRLGAKINVKTYAYGEKFAMGAAVLSFHPAGHVLGSAQIRVEVNGMVWVVSGDYKRETDPSCEPFEVVPCDVFVTEATFGTPAFAWRRTLSIGEEIFRWWKANQALGVTSVVFGYSLGKSQRILAELLPWVGPGEVWIHPALEEYTRCYREANVALCPTQTLDDHLVHSEKIKGKIILAPPSLRASPWAAALAPIAGAFASGWMSGQGSWARTRDGEKSFVISDHADWPALVQTIRESGARQVYTMQRGKGALVRYLNAHGISAASLEALRSQPVDKRQLKLFD